MPKGRPRKTGDREPNGRLRRDAPVRPPAFEQRGLAVCASDYVEREVTEDGQVVGRTVQRKSVLDEMPRSALDGDQLMALRTYEARREAVAYPAGRCTLDRSPKGGGGIEAFHDALRKASEAYQAICAALPPSLLAHVNEVLLRRRDWTEADFVKLRMAGDCLVNALGRRLAA